MATILLASGAFAQTRETIRIGTGVRGGNDYSVGGAICRTVNGVHPRGCAISETRGSHDNLYALALADVNFAIVQADMQGAAWRGEADIGGGRYDDLRSVAALYPGLLTILTRADSDVFEFTDLEDREVSAGVPDSGSFRMFLAAMTAANISPRHIRAQTPSLAVDALCAGNLDALAVVTGHPVGWLPRLADACPLRIVPLDSWTIRAMTRMDSAYRPMMIPGRLYPFLHDSIPTVGTQITISTLAHTSDRLVEAVLTAIFGDLEAFRRQQFVLDPTVWEQGHRTAPLHPAAARFYHDHALLQ